MSYTKIIPCKKERKCIVTDTEYAQQTYRYSKFYDMFYMYSADCGHIFLTWNDNF